MTIADYDQRTGRPLVDGHEAVEELDDSELEVELTVAAMRSRRNSARFDALLNEHARRRARTRQPLDPPS